MVMQFYPKTYYYSNVWNFCCVCLLGAVWGCVVLVDVVVEVDVEASTIVEEVGVVMVDVSAELVVGLLASYK